MPRSDDLSSAHSDGSLAETPGRSRALLRIKAFAPEVEDWGLKEQPRTNSSPGWKSTFSTGIASGSKLT